MLACNWSELYCTLKTTVYPFLWLFLTTVLLGSCWKLSSDPSVSEASSMATCGWTLMKTHANKVKIQHRFTTNRHRWGFGRHRSWWPHLEVANWESFTFSVRIGLLPGWIPKIFRMEGQKDWKYCCQQKFQKHERHLKPFDWISPKLSMPHKIWHPSAERLKN